MKVTTPKAVTKYLVGYAEPEVKLVFDISPHKSFDHVLVIPAYREDRDFFDRLAHSLMKTHSILLIVVINQPNTLGKPDLQNTALWRNISQATCEIWQVEHLQLRSLPRTSSAVLLVDRFKQLSIPHKQGVGLARKIGADLALALISHKLVTDPWIYSSDADAQLPQNYFSAINSTGQSTPRLSTSNKQAVAAVFPYQHICTNDKVGQATRLYERRLQQYVDGLRLARSPYAYHTLGSTLAINATSYAMVRGFPKRNGGEDFYLLNKVAKLGGVLSLSAPKIHIEARQSNRVPFGTGPAVNRLIKEDKLNAVKIFYNPVTFKYLAQWLDLMPSTWNQLLADQALPTLAQQALQNLGIDKAIAAARQTCRSQETYARHMHTWFDGFKTLRFIHLLRDSGLNNISLRELHAFGNPHPASTANLLTNEPY